VLELLIRQEVTGALIKWPGCFNRYLRSVVCQWTGQPASVSCHLMVIQKRYQIYIKLT